LFKGRSIEVKFIIYVFLAILALAQRGQAQTVRPMTVPEIAAYNKPDREKMLYEGAKKEGKLMWYTSLRVGRIRMRRGSSKPNTQG
jgi:hypothetical protein